MLHRRYVENAVNYLILTTTFWDRKIIPLRIYIHIQILLVMGGNILEEL